MSTLLDVIKHLPGQHSQKRHAGSGQSAASSASEDKTDRNYKMAKDSITYLDAISADDADGVEVATEQVISNIEKAPKDLQADLMKDLQKQLASKGYPRLLKRML